VLAADRCGRRAVRSADAEAGQLERAQRLVVTVIAGAMVIVPVMFVMWFSDLNAATLVDQYIAWILLGVALLVLLWRRWQTGPAWLLGVFLLGGVLLIGLGAWDIVGDYFLPRQYVAGEVTGLARVYRRRGFDGYDVYIGGYRFSATAEVYDHLHPGLRIRGEIGTGSHTLLHAQPL
jgi:hypothetical protein